MSEWISVKERLPESEDVVLVCVNGRYGNVIFHSAITVGDYAPNGGWVLGEFPVLVNPGGTHWMQLPDPPEEVAYDD